jgi:hypothetical protein
MTGKENSSVAVVQNGIGLIRSFNPVNHSIDTHCCDALGDVSSPVSSAFNILFLFIAKH